MTSECAVLIAAVASLISAAMALASWWYNRELSRAAISLTEVQVNAKRLDTSSVSIDFLFLLRNVGREPLQIIDLRFGHLEFATKIFKTVGSNTVVNFVYAGAMFNYSASFIVKVDPGLSNEEIATELPRLLGKHVLVLVLRYRGTSAFSRKRKVEKYFLGYEGRGAVYQLTEEEYNEIAGNLPGEFKMTR